MKIITLISMIVFILSIMASKFTVDDSVSGQKTLLNIKDALSQVNAETKYIKVVSEKGSLSKDDVSKLVESSKNVVSNVDNLSRELSNANGILIGTAVLADIQKSSQLIYQSSDEFEKKSKLLKDIELSSNVINRVGNELISVTREVTQALATGRASPGQIYYSSNQTYIMQMILESANKIAMQNSTSIKDAEQLVAYTKQIKSTYGIMLSGDEKGSGRVLNKKAYQILMMNKRKLNTLIKSITMLLSTYPKIESLRATKSQIWTNSSKVEALTKNAIGDINEKISARVSKYSTFDAISALTLLLTIVFGGIALRQKIKEENEQGKDESKAYAELKRELGPIETGDLSNPLTITHAHTKASAVTINRILAGFRKLIIGVKDISGTLQNALAPINVISENQKTIQEDIKRTVDTSNETGIILSDINSEIMSIGNDYEQTVAEYNKLNASLGNQIDELGGIHISMVELSKSISSINENVLHGIESVNQGSNDMSPKLSEVSSLMINLTLIINSLPDTDAKKEIESHIDTICRKVEETEVLASESNQQLKTVKQQSKNLSEEFEQYRDVIQSASSGNIEVSSITSKQNEMSTKMATLSKSLLDKIHSMHSIASKAILLVSDVQESAKRASDASQELASVVNNTSASIDELNEITKKYTV